MRVKCRSNKDSFLIEHNNITVGKIYDVIGLSKEYSMGTDMYTIKDDNGFNFTHGISVFTLIAEDKMDQVRIIRKLEDLDGLENGMGLKVFLDKNDYSLSTGIPWQRNVINRVNAREKEEVEYFLKSLKAMGFKFEYKPTRTLNEVVEEMKLETDDVFEDGADYELYEVAFEKSDKHYKIRLAETVGAPVFIDAKLAQIYADELNEILRGR